MAIHFLQDLQVERQFARLPSSQATANSTKTLTVADAPIQYFTGTTQGQIVQMPNATTLVVGMMYEIINASTMPIRINDGAASPVLLVWLSQGRRARLILIDNSSQAGVWTIDAAQSGANENYAENAGPVTNSSGTVWVTAVTFTTEVLPLADYTIEAYSRYSPGASNRAPIYRLTQGGTQIGKQQALMAGPTGGANGSYPFAYFTKALGLSGSLAINLEFVNNSALGAATITVTESKLRLVRV